MSFDPSKVLFVGLGKSAVAWYRCYLPALYLGCDWAGYVGDPPQAQMITGLVKRETRVPIFTDYDIVVLQQVTGPQWLKFIRELQERGIKVLYECDDYLHGIKNQRDHDFREHYTPEYLAKMEMCLRACDGMIASTNYIGRRYRKFNSNVFVCENGLDTARYRLTRPPRPTVNIGWSGATAHRNAVEPWLQVVADVMEWREKTCFISVGQPYANAFQQVFGNRALAIPFTSIETYPAAMTMFDIALAPSGNTNFFAGKSDLRWLEAGALGIPVIANPTVYPKITHGENGFHAETPADVEELLNELVQNEELRTAVGESAQSYVANNRDMRIACMQWANAFEEML